MSEKEKIAPVEIEQTESLLNQEIDDKEELQESTTLVDPTMEGVNDPKPVKSVKQVVEEKGHNVFLSEDNRTLIVKGSMSFSNKGKKSIEDYYPTEEDLALINKYHSNVDLKRTRDSLLYFDVCGFSS